MTFRGRPRTQWHKLRCQTCHNEFGASRIDANFCSGRCRIYWARHGHPYPTVKQVEDKTPSLFEQTATEVGMTPDELKDHFDKQDKVIDAWVASGDPPPVQPPVQAVKKTKPTARTKPGTKKLKPSNTKKQKTKKQKGKKNADKK